MLAHHIGPFTCEVTRGEGHAVVAPRGELDMATVGSVDEAIKELRRSGVDSIVLDLAGLTFMDSSGLHLVIRWANEASRDGFVFELKPGPPNVERVFDLAAVRDTLPWRRTD